MAKNINIHKAKEIAKMSPEEASYVTNCLKEKYPLLFQANIPILTILALGVFIYTYVRTNYKINIEIIKKKKE